MIKQMASFHGVTFRSSLENLTKLIGIPTYESNHPNEDVKFSWGLVLEGGERFFITNEIYRSTVFEAETIVSWKIYSSSRESSNEILNNIIKKTV
jgi:hypothetical protein